MSEKDYKNLEVWRESRKLVSVVYKIVQSFPEEEKYGLSSQLKRAAISVPSNIAEGIARNHNKETKQFFYIAKGSIYEIETQMYLALDLNLINQDQADKIFIQLTLVRKLLIGFIKYLEK